MFQKKKKKGFWGILEPFLIVKKGFKICFNRDSGKDGGLVAWWDRFRFGCKTLQGGVLK
ncbi:hypothetical protein [Helicobacter pylori]|uniref:hypothetical protein n=1 Tax=Helicobacter pylori TaxID=210 RepID=UPI0013E2C9C4|nr:hypothetical protein [Helicobacter pylori]